MFLFQLPIILFTPPLQQIRVTTLLESWRDLYTAGCGRLRKRHHCLSSNNGTSTSSQIILGSQQSITKTSNFLVGTRALGIIGSHYLQKEIRRDARRFLEDFVNCILSTVAARSVIGQGISCFCPAIVVGGDDVVPLQIFNKLLDGLLEKGWARGSEVEAFWAEYQSFVQEQRQLERSSTRSRPNVGDVLSFCSAQAGFRARRHLYKICIVANQASGFNPFVLSHPSMRLSVSGVPVDDA